MKSNLNIIKLLELERYIPVMTRDELRLLEEGETGFGTKDIARWKKLLADRSKKMNDRFEAAYKRQEELCRQSKAKK
ncbi:MAG TPA: hypothetical protein IAC47_00945 [Candidatus Onthomorpha intestinigallinarum]|uniref:Uncharacterized protein n=1 Tax=Candidatus Onthomorpha intestinigallinarum TaxID=2840880 RepID=A0A9D1RHU1_9BACT|nr:hypothetical protein [Candidatus Onthomorpha intestinigallinarum]